MSGDRPREASWFLSVAAISCGPLASLAPMASRHPGAFARFEGIGGPSRATGSRKVEAFGDHPAHDPAAMHIQASAQARIILERPEAVPRQGEAIG